MKELQQEQSGHPKGKRLDPENFMINLAFS